ncbi:MAG: rhodanese-like domain-containing protein [Magnetococcales bacterium]|nr:rhodanese-like domain-containing protein [Magnetococcales bacterium]
MSWFQQNWQTVVFAVVMFAFLFRGPIMGRIYGVKTLSVHDLSKLLANDNPPLLVDVRTEPEYNRGHVQQAVLVPLHEVKKRMAHLKQNNEGREIAVICQSGNRSMMGSVHFRKAGFETVYNVSGGTGYWQGQGYTVVQ